MITLTHILYRVIERLGLGDKVLNEIFQVLSLWNYVHLTEILTETSKAIIDQFFPFILKVVKQAKLTMGVSL